MVGLESSHDQMGNVKVIGSTAVALLLLERIAHVSVTNARAAELMSNGAARLDVFGADRVSVAGNWTTKMTTIVFNVRYSMQSQPTTNRMTILTVSQGVFVLFPYIFHLGAACKHSARLPFSTLSPSDFSEILGHVRTWVRTTRSRNASASAVAARVPATTHSLIPGSGQLSRHSPAAVSNAGVASPALAKIMAGPMRNGSTSVATFMFLWGSGTHGPAASIFCEETFFVKKSLGSNFSKSKKIGARNIPQRC